jgi:hypothetical protein
MEQGDINTVTISLREYVKLRDFKKGMEGKLVYTTHIYPNPYGTYFYTKDEAVAKIAKLSKDREIELLNKIGRAECLLEQEKVKFKSMSIWEFIKYRNSK